MIRPDWDTYFIRIAKEVSSRATCLRAQVGAVVVKDNRILSTGYNGASAGEHHCSDEGCLMYEGHCIRCIHAEENAIMNAARFGIPLDGATLYYWDSGGRYSQSMESFAEKFPVQARLVKAAGIVRVVGRGL